MASTQTNNSVNIELLKQASDSNPKYKAIFELFGERQRGRQDTTMPRIRRVLKDKHVDITLQELAEFFRLAQGANAGRWHQGRSVSSGRFVWNYNLKSVADVVNGKATPIRNAPKAKHRLPKIDIELGTPVIEEVSTPINGDVTPSEGTPTLAQFAAEAFPTPGAQHRTVLVRKGGLEIEIHMDELTQEDLKNAAVLLNNLAVNT